MFYLNVNKTKGILLRFTFLLITFALYITDISFGLVNIYSCLICLSLVILYYLEHKSLFKEYIVVLLFMVLFHFGQVMVYLIHPKRYLPVFDRFGEESIRHGVLYSLLCVLFFDLFYNFVECRVKRQRDNISCSSTYLDCGYKISKIGIIVLAPLVLVETCFKTIFSLQNGYMNLYAYDGTGYNENAIMPYLRNLFVIVCILNITSSSYDKRKARVPLGLMIVYAVLMFLSGSRSGCLSVIFPAILLYVNQIKKEKKEKVMKYAIIAGIILTASVFMSYFRLIESKSSSGVMDALSYAIESNPMTETMVEMGGSIQPLLYCIKIFSNGEVFRYGKSYFASFLLLVPNVFHFMGRVHPAAKETNLAQWLMDYEHMDHGPGFSIIAESYYNFGEVGFLLFSLWGIIFCRIIGDTRRQNQEKNFISYATLTLVFSLIRGSTSDFIRYFVFEVLILNMIVKVVASILRTNRKATL